MSGDHPDSSPMTQPAAALKPPWSQPSQRSLTRDNTLLGAVFGVGLTLFFYAFLYGLEHLARVSIPLAEKFMYRGWTPYVAVFLTFWSLSILVDKFIAARRQRHALVATFVPPDASFETADDVQRVLSHVDATSRKENDKILGYRIRRAIEHYVGSRNPKEVGDILRDENEAAMGELEDSYTLLRAFLWSIPILGFVGTVMGVSEAVGGFSSFLTAVQNVEEIKSALGDVTTRLSVAFDTTFVALALSLLVMMVMSTVEKYEVGQLRRIDEHCQRHVIHRLPTERARSQSDMELLVGSLQHVFQDLTGKPAGEGWDSAKDVFGNQREALAEAIGKQEEMMEKYVALLGSSRQDLEALVGARNDLEKEILEGPAAAVLSGTLKKLQDSLDQLAPALRRLAEKPIEVDVHLVAGQVSTSARRSED